MLLFQDDLQVNILPYYRTLLFQVILEVNILPYYCYVVFFGALQENIYGCDAGSQDHRYLIYTRWRIPHCGQAKIEAGSQALVVLTELTQSMIICVFFIAEMDQVDNKSSFMQLKSIQYTNAEKYSVFCSIF